MKTILLFTLLFTSHIAFSQSLSDSFFVLDKIPESGIALNKGWKFHQGDDTRWASPLLKDQSWQNIDPEKPLGEVTQFKDGNIGWLRLKLKVGKSWQGQKLALTVDQFGASEIYLNGKLVYTYGKVSAQTKGEIPYNPLRQPTAIFLSQAKEQLLAVRYSVHTPHFYNLYQPLLFVARLNTPFNEWNNYETSIELLGNYTMLLGVFFIITILHFFLYLFYKTKKVNLYLSLYTLFIGLAFVGNNWIIHSADIQILKFILFTIAAPLGFIFYLTAVYELFELRKNRWFQFLCVFSIAASFSEWFPWSSEAIIEWIGIFGPGILVTIEIIRQTIIAVKKNFPSSKLFLVGQTISFLFFCLMSLTGFFESKINPSLFNFIYAIFLDGSFLIPPILISYILATDFAKTNISLAERLKQVEKLSAENLAQEQEKQQFLASQNEKLEQQVEERTVALKNSLQKLKTTQAQLIQSEKMASMGELTAGIAHEIQNPLNFVNNFSEVSMELVDEMQEEMETGDVKEASAIATDIKQNLEKIIHHGKRADGIVKGMLQHSRNNSGEQQLTDLNVLADEYLRLSYQGLRAKDKTFNAILTTNFQEDLAKIAIIPQDIGRVLLNLFNNAFYAVQQKQKVAGADYKPEVAVTTSFTNNLCEIKVNDNGTGIPEGIKDKILQPFFTTKPTGEGTGLGLSLSYDIIVKGHGGNIKINSQAEEYTEVIVQIPSLKTT
jgi:two-component system NtrC family sensor kinase